MLTVEKGRKGIASQHPETRNATPDRWFHRVAAAVFLLCAFYFTFFWIAHRDGVRMRDFLAPYTGSRCLWAGCNPYDLPQVQHEFARAGGLQQDHPTWAFEPPVYPPSTLVALLPLSFLHYHAARAVWYGLTAALFFAASLALISFAAERYRPWAMLLGAFLYWSEPVGLSFNIGQPTGVAVSLAILSLWLFFRNHRSAAAVICLGISLALKPQLAGLFLIYFLLQSRFRTYAFKSAALGAAFLIVGILCLTLSPASHQWRSDYRTQVANSQAPGAVNDPSPQSGYARQFTDAQIVFALFDNSPSRDTKYAYVLGAILFSTWIVILPRTPEEDLFQVLAAIACIGMLPFYHREYDLVLLMISFPALIEMMIQRHKVAWSALFCTICLLSSPHYHHLWIKLETNAKLAKLLPDETIRALVFTRWQPLVLCVLACIYLLSMSRQKNGSA